MTGTAAEEIVALEDSLTKATRALDIDALDRIDADDIIMTSVLGEPCGKTVVQDEARRGVAQREIAASAGKPITSSYDKEDLKVSAGGDAAVASYRFVVRIQGDGIDVNRRYRTTNVWMKRQGRWQIVAAHTGFVLSRKQAASLAGEAKEDRDACSDQPNCRGGCARPCPVGSPLSRAANRHPRCPAHRVFGLQAPHRVQRHRGVDGSEGRTS